MRTIQKTVYSSIDEIPDDLVSFTINAYRKKVAEGKNTNPFIISYDDHKNITCLFGRKHIESKDVVTFEYTYQYALNPNKVTAEGFILEFCFYDVDDQGNNHQIHRSRYCLNSHRDYETFREEFNIKSRIQSKAA